MILVHDQSSLMLDYRVIFFVISLLVVVPMLIYYYRRHPNPRFRPHFGEMVMVSLFALLLCTTGSFMLGGLMQDPEQFRPSAEMGMVPGGQTTPGDSDGVAGKSSKRKSSGRERHGPPEKPERSGFGNSN